MSTISPQLPRVAGIPTMPILPASLPYTQGRIFHVRPGTGSDANDGKSPRKAFATLAAALAAATANQNDVVLLYAESNTASATTDYQSVLLDWNKGMVHLVGVNSGSFLGQRSRIAPLSTAATFANLFRVSANGCLIQNIEFYQANTATNPSSASTCVGVTGDRNHFVNCQISGIGHADLDDAGSNSLTVTGSENVFDDCYIGLDTIIRATAAAEIVMTGAPTRNMFRRCKIHSYTSLTTFKAVSVPTGADRWVRFDDCDFVATQNISSAAVPTGVIGITTMNGEVLVRNPFISGYAQIVTADNAYVKVLGYNGVATGHLVGISQAVDAT